MTVQDLKRRIPFMKYLGFCESKRMWVYTYDDRFDSNRMYGLTAGNLKVTHIPTLDGLHLTKA
jgi:hypothetical protein